MIEIIDDFYKHIIENNCISIYICLFCCSIDSMGKDEKSYLIKEEKFKTGFATKDTPMALYHPTDTKQDDCKQIFVKNYKMHHGDFVRGLFEF